MAKNSFASHHSVANCFCGLYLLPVIWGCLVADDPSLLVELPPQSPVFFYVKLVVNQGISYFAQGLAIKMFVTNSCFSRVWFRIGYVCRITDNISLNLENIWV